LVIAGVLALVTVLGIFGSFYTVEQTERGVLLRNGALVEVVEPGLSFKIPFIDKVETISLQSMTTSYEGLDAYSKDQQPAKLTVSVSWHVNAGEVQSVYTKYKTLDSLVNRVVSRQVPTQVENVFGQFNAVSAVQQRVTLVADLQKAIRASVGTDVVIDSVQLENIDFSNKYEAAIADRMDAEVKVKTKDQELQKEKIEAQITVTKAQATADSTLANARATATATRIQGDAEADAIRAKAKALAENASLVELTKAERWNGQLPTTMLPNAALPFLTK
jgi:regulator of protease activity HflC (stomatin/prohibitin superfamily)